MDARPAGLLQSLQPYAITLFFLVMMGLLTRDHVVPMFEDSERLRVEPSVLQDSWLDRDETMRLFLGEREVGALRISSERIAGASPQYRFRMTMELRGVLNGTVKSWAIANRLMELEQFEAHVQTKGFAGLAQGLDLSLAGLVQRDELLLRIVNGEQLNYRREKLKAPIVLTDSLENVLPMAQSNRTKPYRVDIVDPIFTGQPQQALVLYQGTEQRAVGDLAEPQLLHKFRVQMGLLVSTYWLTDGNRIMRREIRVLTRERTSSRAREAMKQADAIAKMIPAVVLEVSNIDATRRAYPALNDVPQQRDLRAERMVGEGGADSFAAWGILSQLRRGATANGS